MGDGRWESGLRRTRRFLREPDKPGSPVCALHSNPAMAHTTLPPENQSHPHPGQAKVASGLNVLAGLYLMLSSSMNGGTGGNRANGVVCGAIVVILAAQRLVGKARAWAGWIDAAIGVWIVFAPWVFSYAGDAWMWNDIVVGVVIVALGIWSATATASDDTIGARMR